MAAYPDTLPAPLVAGYEINPEDPNLRTQMDAGPDRTRRRFSTIPSRVPVKWRFTLVQLALFDAWHKYTALDGSAWFTINLASGMGISALEAKFSKPPKKVMLSGMSWEVSSELEVRTLPVLSQLEMDLALIYPPDELNYGSSALHTLTNTTLPQSNYW